MIADIADQISITRRTRHNAIVGLRMKISLKPQHLKRYREIAQLIARFGFSEALRASGLEDLIGGQNALTRRAHPEPNELADSLEALGFCEAGPVAEHARRYCTAALSRPAGGVTG
jgi:hypothetical protein